ncbi:phosphoribosyltransferase family protein [Paenibacillus polymyxa]|uniref:phosphoribosyltransferase family protein n=1 Tax=Paenibacillus TaxID=44249 RepID=UPI000D31374A|nr:MULTISPECIES: phosphoribosyltransferase family protein [Paenibacillus]KAF6585155.1 phosphoribosyltransferase domain-containing protein [Paenibacillus sp. EKM211P]KAF6618578.1 phosphoribosyltransferase domain-containing protein [Paenibacillus sp. EKM101P]KAF6624958.1 phosphoribosyltransferase domain-containing protein [Paenibacillus sp. EKM102P]KAF6636243.1 phosphoribosyltransferase domain-containing protein [Paenibacillus sp. EKM10P]KAF6649030.1 phosphoribosyltransferase domain-containing p
MAARVNKKRSFLFVSKVLGKHISVNPYTSLLSGAALAILLYKELVPQSGQQMDKLIGEAVRGLLDPNYAKEAYQKLMDERLAFSFPEPIKFVGFAETATALGHSMYRLFDGGATYIHTTREDIPGLRPIIRFEEEHSHAVDHRCYALNEDAFAGDGPIVLVDDEITTGKTTLNIIRDIQEHFPRKQYVIASLLDWRTDSDERAFADLEAELDIRITPLSLLKGKIEIQGTPVLDHAEYAGQTGNAEHAATSTAEVNKDLSGTIDRCFEEDASAFERISHTSISTDGYANTAPYLKYTGRFGLQSADNPALDAEIAYTAERLNQLRSGQRTLVMGTGEFMYIPMRIAAELGPNVYYQSTTRSPVYPHREEGYGVASGVTYPSPEDSTVRNFIYNVEPGQYDEIFVLLERESDPERMKPMLEALSRLGCDKVHVVYFNGLTRQESKGARI